jgi:transposase
MHVEPHCSQEELLQRIRTCNDHRLRRRMQLIYRAMQKLTAEEVGQQVKLCRRQVQKWVQRFNADGLKGLHDRPGRGSPLPLTAEQQIQLEKRLAAGPRAGDGICTLRGKQVQHILATELGVYRKLSSVYYLLHRLGFECLMPRPQHPKADPARQEQFKKKNSRKSLTKSGKNTGKSNSLCSLRTKRVSVSKAR